ncbi:Lrp/AsnC family transcriptional regulator [Microbacterium sp. BWT-B31]|uniref:Lrp/AsnC family transcriptional regulator n=1 Tax=Microbacterium sp. BWT-B31 TaxID=3232072 RepID=UPI0035278FC9
MDDLDDRILGILLEDGRASFSAIGRAVGLSTNAAAARVRRLESTGVIAGYRAVLGVDEPIRNDAIEAFIDVRLRSERDSDAFLSWARALASVMDAAHVTGPFDYHLHIRVRDMAALDALLRTLKKDGGVEQTSTTIALR